MVWQAALLIGSGALQAGAHIKSGRAAAKSAQAQAELARMRKRVNRINASRIISDTRREVGEINGATLASAAVNGALSAGSPRMVMENNLAEAALTIARVEEDLNWSDKGADIDIANLNREARYAKQAGTLSALSALTSAGVKAYGVS